MVANSNYINKVTNADCLEHIRYLADSSVDLLLSDIPYGINIAEWDVLHNNSNSALLGSSPANKQSASGFKTRGKPINGWSEADKNIGKEYQDWCYSWSSQLYPKLKDGASCFIFGARRTLHRVINAFEDSGFLLKDVLAWKKPNAHHRAQKLNNILANRGLADKLEAWEGWRLGNLAPIYEPIAWFFKPYKRTITDNILEHSLGAINLAACKLYSSNATNLLGFSLTKEEKGFHETQKPIALMEFLIKLTTVEHQVVLDPFMGSGTTALAAKRLARSFIGFEINSDFVDICNKRLS